MNLFPLFAGVAFLAAGTAGLVVATRVNGSVLAGFRGEVDSSGGFTEGDEDFSYEGSVDHRPGAKRRIVASLILIAFVAIVGALLAGSIVLIFRALWSVFSKFAPA